MTTTETKSVAMTTTHRPSMNLRFVLRSIPGQVMKVRILQQMMIPNDWNTHEEFWQDVPLVDEQ